MIPLPEIIELNDYGGNIDTYEQTIHEEYLNIFKNPPIYFNGKLIIPIKYPLQHKDRHWTFSHMTSNGKVEDEREYDLRRCERIGWIKPILQQLNSRPTCLKIWKQRRNSRNRVMVWYEDINFVIVLQVESKYYKLVTTFIAHKHRRDDLTKEYQDFLKNVASGKATAV